MRRPNSADYITIIFFVGEDMIFGEGSEYMYPMTAAAAASACR